jgi:hypothetical protein
MEPNMREEPNISPAAPSRRNLLRSFALTAGGAAMFGATMRGASAQTKVPQTSVGYQATPNGAAQCDNCLQFAPPSSCKIVDGTIAPTGWCKIYAKKPT